MSDATGAPALRRNGYGWYLYGVVADGSVGEPVAGASVDPGHEVTLVSEGPLAGVTSRVALDEFDEAALPTRLKDPAWLERKIRAHERVLEDVLAVAPVVPCRFCTIYRSEDELRGFLAGRSEALASALDGFDGAAELGVKVFLDAGRFAAARASHNAAIAQLQARVSDAVGGRAYLEGRQLEKLVAAELASFAAELGELVHERLLAASETGRTLPLQEPELSGRELPMAFNGAYLVADRERFEDALVTLAEEFREQGAVLELSGPWPPYNFVPAELSSS